MGRLVLPAGGISHREEVCWGCTGGYIWVNGAARWKRTHPPHLRLGVLQGSRRSVEIPVHLGNKIWGSLTWEGVLAMDFNTDFLALTGF